jgi:hypothetical protein
MVLDRMESLSTRMLRKILLTKLIDIFVVTCLSRVAFTKNCLPIILLLIKCV